MVHNIACFCCQEQQRRLLFLKIFQQKCRLKKKKKGQKTEKQSFSEGVEFWSSVFYFGSIISKISIRGQKWRRRWPFSKSSPPKLAVKSKLFAVRIFVSPRFRRPSIIFGLQTLWTSRNGNSQYFGEGLAGGILQ